MSAETGHTGCGGGVLDAVRKLYRELALSPATEFGWKKGREGARSVGYDDRWLAAFPDAVWESAAPVGNPFVLGTISSGQTVLDLGCGAGVDVCIAATLVGQGGRAIGVDITPEMVDKARANALLLGLRNTTFIVADMSSTGIAADSVDVVISNGSINLSPGKPCVLREAARVLRPGGRLYLADMIRVGEAPCPQVRASSPESWANCVEGVVTRGEMEKLLADAGFRAIEFVGMTGYRTAPTTEGTLFRAVKPGGAGLVG